MGQLGTLSATGKEEYTTVTIVELAMLVMKQERVGWSKAMLIAMERREEGDQRRALEAQRARERRAERRQEAQDD